MLTDNFGLYNLLVSAQMVTRKYASETHSGGERRQNCNVNLLELGYNESRGNSGHFLGHGVYLRQPVLVVGCPVGLFISRWALIRQEGFGGVFCHLGTGG